MQLRKRLGALSESLNSNLHSLRGLHRHSPRRLLFGSFPPLLSCRSCASHLSDPRAFTLAIIRICSDVRRAASSRFLARRQRFPPLLCVVFSRRFDSVSVIRRGRAYEILRDQDPFRLLARFRRIGFRQWRGCQEEQVSGAGGYGRCARLPQSVSSAC